MAAVLALVAFLLSLVFHVAGGSVYQYWTDAMLVGLCFVALALIFPGWWGLRGPRG